MENTVHLILKGNRTLKKSSLLILKQIGNNLVSQREWSVVEEQPAQPPVLCMEGKVTDGQSGLDLFILIRDGLDFKHHIGGGCLQDDCRMERVQTQAEKEYTNRTRANCTGRRRNKALERA